MTRGLGWRALGVIAIAVMIALVSWTELGQAASRSSGSDMDAYWNAALRLRAGDPLYLAGNPTDSDLYRYAPWFAAAWIPLTFLPKDAVLVGWMLLCLAAAIFSVAPLLWRGPAGIALFALLLPFQLEGAAYGNVQPILVLALLWGVERRSGPLWIALAASLKATPVVLVLVYAGRREWRRALLALLLTGILVAPMLLFDLRGYSTASGGGQMSLLGDLGLRVDSGCGSGFARCLPAGPHAVCMGGRKRGRPDHAAAVAALRDRIRADRPCRPAS